jgi:hypothetical protein
MVDERLVERFNAKWRKDDSGCWLWQAAIAGKGYGQLRAIPRRLGYLYAHRFSWEMVNGPIPDGLMVLHSCDVPACVNPEHLFLGTNADNHKDMKAKDRHLYGERNAEAKLTERDILDIYALSDASVAQKAIGAKFGIGQGCAWKIIHGHRWNHLYLRERRGT